MVYTRHISFFIHLSSDTSVASGFWRLQIMVHMCFLLQLKQNVEEVFLTIAPGRGAALGLGVPTTGPLCPHPLNKLANPGGLDRPEEGSQEHRPVRQGFQHLLPSGSDSHKFQRGG